MLPPWTAIGEIVVIYAALLTADWLHPGLELSDIRPHPFWFPVLLLSLQYGTVSGLLSAMIAIALLALGGFREQTPSETYFTYLLTIWAEPILWIGAAVLLGHFRMRQIGLKRDLVFRVNELESQRAALADFATNLRTHCTALERQIAGRTATPAIAALQALELVQARGAALAVGTMDEPLAQVMAAAMPGTRAALYIADQSGMRLAAGIGAGTDTGPARQSWIAPSDPLYLSIVAAGRAVSVLTVEGETALGGKGLAAVPIFAPLEASAGTSRRVVGMLQVDEMDPAHLGPACLPALSAIGRAFAPALQIKFTSTGQKAAESTTAALLPPAAAAITPMQRMARRLRWFGATTGEPEATPSEPAARAPSKATS